jgi:predicted Rossmann fold nucleotide-binding protein DprA/Smf involved in DNA uptake
MIFAVPLRSCAMQAERIAIVGSRQGADLEQVERFVRALYLRQPSSLLISGGAAGVDKLAEQTWMSLGGRVQSFRPKQLEQERYGVEVWNLGEMQPSVGVLGEPHPTWRTYAGAAWYRNLLIAEKADRVVAFYRRFKSAGAASTIDAARAEGKPLYEYEAAA